MSNPSQIVKIPSNELKDKHGKSVLKSVASTDSEEEEEFWPLSGKPYFNVILSKSHVKPRYQLSIPSKIHPVFPSTAVPLILTYGGKNWETCYYRDPSNKMIQVNWKTFVIDNDLKVGDACVLELMECRSTDLKFRVQILRGDFPSELLVKVDGETPTTPIILE